MNTYNMTADQHEAMSRLVRDGRRGPEQTGLSVRTYRALQRRGLIVPSSGSGQRSLWVLTADGHAWANENI